MPFGIQYPAPAPTSDPGFVEDPQTKMIQDLIASLETPPAPTAPPAGAPPPTALQDALFGGTPRHFAGALGDAIAAMAAVKAGGAPPPMGAFAASQQRQAELAAQQLQEYQKRQEENAAAERMLRNQARISVFQEGQKQTGAEAIANIRAKGTRGLKSEFVRDVNGESHRFVRLLDPTTGYTMPLVDPKTGEQVEELDLGPAGYAPAIIPGMMNGQAIVARVPRNTGPATPVMGTEGARLEPPTPPTLVQQAGGQMGVLKGIPGLKEAYDAADKELRGSGKIDQVIRWAQSRASNTSAAPLVQPVAMQKYYANMRSTLFPYVRSLSGLVFPESELVRYEGRMPIPGVTDPEVVDSQWASLIQEMVRDIQEKYKAAGRTAPAIPSGTAAPTPTVDEILKQVDEERNANPTP
jgi:hypothetical protein